LDIFAEYDAVVINDTENCDNPKFAVLANFLREKEVKSAIFLPINSGSRLVGFIGASFLRIKHNFSDGAVYILRSAVNMYLLAHAREMQRRNLLRSEKEKNTIWESMPIPLALFNPQRQIVRVNPALERLTHKTSKQVVAGSCFKIFFERSVPCEDCPFDYVMRTGEGASRETTIFDREYRIMALPIFEDDRLVNILQCYVDVTLSNQVKRELEAALEAAQSANQAKSVFLATMSHEIRTPLNAVIGFSELLHNNNELSEPERLEYLKSINLGGRALLLLINDILDLSKLEAGKMVLNTEKCNLNNLISELRSIFALRAKEKSLELNLHINSDLPGMYLCVQRLRQVLLNLLGNAVKFTNCGEINIDVDFVKQDFEQGVLTIKVADTGIGIAKSCQEQIFKPFIQQNRSSQEGTGLGLAISKRLVDDMNGTLTFVSVENKGTCFTCIIPKVKYCSEITPQNAENLPELEWSSDRKLLIVDDVQLNLKVLGAMLKKLKVNYITASSGLEALEKIASEHPDAVLTDIWMPGMNGAELAADIRRNRQWDHIGIYAVTADCETEHNFKTGDFAGILFKPLALNKLEEFLRKIE
ncbi:MAG: ATP-binding protein, partial [Victivallaceae bacterium]